jgi:hypothetical protein
MSEPPDRVGNAGARRTGARAGVVVPCDAAVTLSYFSAR